METALQAKLLRFVENHSFRRIGGEKDIQVNCRVIAATHRDLAERIHEGRFRDDLYFRLAVVQLQVPALRERREDLLPLAHMLIQQIAYSIGRPIRPLHPASEKALLEHDWPGNIRELCNRIERALVLGEDPQILPADLDLHLLFAAPGHVTLLELEDPARLRRLLQEEGWNIARAARRLGVARHWLKYRMAKFHLHRPSAD
jgi:DNA-binding NtrC family response regulator